MTEDLLDDLPAGLREQHRQAEARRREVYEDTPKRDAEPEQEPDAPEEPEEPEETPAPAAHGSEEDPQAAPAEPETTDWQKEYRRLEAAHSTLQGKYRAEVPRLSQELRELKAQTQSLREQLEASQQPPAKEATQEVLDKIREEYGPELAELFSKYVDATTKEQVKPMAERFEHLEQRQQHSDQQRFLAELGHAVPDWQRINADPGFSGDDGWLAQIDPMTGRRRQDALDEAAAAQDASRVAAIFQLYQADAGHAPPAPGAPPAQTPAEDPREARKRARDQQIAPGKKRPGKAPPETPKAYSADDLKDLERRARNGTLNDTDYKREMAAIHAAINEGRFAR